MSTAYWPSKDAHSACSINDLPVEVLLQIFVLALELIPRKQRCESTLSLTLSHTCRTWRDVTLEGKSLWIFVPLFSTNIARLYLERSNPLPVNFQYSYPRLMHPSRYADAFRWVLHDLSRVRELIHIDGRSGWDQVVLGRHRNASVFKFSSAPLLEALSLVMIGDLEALRSQMFDNSTHHSLHDLSLYICNLPNNAFVFSSALTHLEVTFCQNTWSCLAHSLKNLVCLEVLKITQHHSVEETTDLQPFAIAETLRVFEIRANSTATLSFISAARIPAQAAVRVTPVDNMLARESQPVYVQTFPLMITDLVDAVFSRITTALHSGFAYDRLLIADLGLDSTEIKMWVEPPEAESRSLDKLSPYTTTLVLAHTRRDRHPELAFGALIIALTQLRTIRAFQTLPQLGLSLELLDNVRNAHVWRAVADCFPQVEKIALGRTGLVRVLGDADYRNIFPSLKVVLLWPGVGVARSIVLNARQNRDGVRFVSMDLLPYFPDHNLPFDDDID